MTFDIPMEACRSSELLMNLNLHKLTSEGLEELVSSEEHHRPRVCSDSCHSSDLILSIAYN